MAADDVDLRGLHEAVDVGIAQSREAEGVLIVDGAVTVVGVQIGGQGQILVQGPGAVAHLVVGDLTARVLQKVLVAVDGMHRIVADIPRADVGVIPDHEGLDDVLVPVGLIQIHVIAQIVEIHNAILGHEGGHVAVGGEDTELVGVVPRHDGGLNLGKNDALSRHVLDVLVLDVDAQVLLHRGVHLVQSVIQNVDVGGGGVLAVDPGARVADADHPEGLTVVVLLLHVGEKLGDGLGRGAGACVGGDVGGLGSFTAGGKGKQHEGGQQNRKNTLSHEIILSDNGFSLSRKMKATLL